MLLKELAIVMGILIVVTRGMCVIFPGFVKKLMKLFLEEKGVLLLMMVLGAILGAVFIWGFRLKYEAAAVGQTHVGWQAYVLLVFGIAIVLMSLLSLAAPKVLTGFMTRMADASSAMLRVLCLMGVVAGVLIFLMGLSM